MFEFLLPFDDGTYSIILNNLTPEDAVSVLDEIFFHSEPEQEPAWIYDPHSMYNL